MTNSNHTITNNLPKDFLSSVVVFLTALPLCMGISLASGAPVEAGLITGIVGGILVGILSGSSFQVSGPAAGLSVLVLEYIQSHGLSTLGAILICAGFLQILGGYLRIGQMFRAVSPAVVNGMLSGIGLLIIVGQFLVMLGYGPKGSGFASIAAMPAAIGSFIEHAREGAGADEHSSFIAGLLGLATIAIMLAWKKFAPKALQVIPGPLVAIASVTAYAAATHSPVHYVNVPANIFGTLSFPDFAAFSKIGIGPILENVFAFALIASAETLLSANAVDRLHKGPRCKYDRELIAQGVGNTVCGLVGGLPMTGVIARSSVNVHAGARTRMSAIFHGCWLLLFVSFFPSVLKMVPVSCLAALLVVTGAKLIDMTGVRKLWGYGKKLVGIYAATVVCIISTDLLTGVMLGVALSILKLIYSMSRLDISVVKEPPSKVSLQLTGSATFISLPKLAGTLESLPADCELHVCLERLDYLDHACLELFMDWKEQHESSGGTLVIDWGEIQAAFKYKSRRQRAPSPFSTIAVVEPAQDQELVTSR